MKYKDLFELRRNPEVNKKIAGYQEAIKFLESIPKNELFHYGISMTNLPKLGVNPGSEHNTTPLGIYFYPARYYLQLVKSGEEVPYMSDAKYINIIKLKDVKTLWINFNYLDDDGLIDDMANAMANVIGISEAERSTFVDRVTHLAKRETDEYSGDTRIWKAAAYICRSGLDRLMRKKSGPSFMTVWNKLLRSIGIMVVIDDGYSVIHDNEPNQGVVLDPRAIEGFKTFDNIKPVSSEPITDKNFKQVDLHKMSRACVAARKRNKFVERHLIDVLKSDFYITGFFMTYILACMKGVRWPEFEALFPKLTTESINLSRIIQYWSQLGLPDRLPGIVENRAMESYKSGILSHDSMGEWETYCKKYNVREQP